MVLVRGFYSLENRLFKFSLNKNGVNVSQWRLFSATQHATQIEEISSPFLGLELHVSLVLVKVLDTPSVCHIGFIVDRSMLKLHFLETASAKWHRIYLRCWLRKETNECFRPRRCHLG